MRLSNNAIWEKGLKYLPDSYRTWFTEENRYLVSNITKNAKVLEVGCGEGRTLDAILVKTKNLTGLDHDKIAVKNAKKKFKSYSKIKMIYADADNIPFSEDSFDFVICMTTFANFGEKKFQILAEMKRVSRDDGFIILSVYADNAFEDRIKLYKADGAFEKIKEIKGTTVIFDESIGDNISEQFSREELIYFFKKLI
jgi:ubiquinone/menaquinone biosynthesis C-methylase UbiE